MLRQKINQTIGGLTISFLMVACHAPKVITRVENDSVPMSYNGTQDTANIAKVKWRDYFKDPHLQALIDTALNNNQELNITMQEVAIAQNDIGEKHGEYLPFVGLRGSAGVDKVGRYTNIGALEDNIEIKDGKKMPDPMTDFLGGAYASWEIDIWHKLHNAEKAAVSRYLSTVEGKNFMVTNLIAEIADSYYELLSLDNQMGIVKQNIAIQTNALDIIKVQKEATRVTELAVRKFEAEVLKTKSLQYDIQQQIIEQENKINFLLGRYPQEIVRDSNSFVNVVPADIKTGIPSQLLANRPDIRSAEYDLQAAKLDVQVAKARFYPSLGISASVGYNAFNPAYLLNTPKSLIYSLAGDLTAPLINKNAIKAAYLNANAKQIQAVFNYEQTILNAYVEVANQLAKVNNLDKSYDLKSKQVDALNQSISISNDLFQSARADYMEVLMTQRDALESKFELVETQKKQLMTMVNVYRALGGGWN